MKKKLCPFVYIAHNVEALGSHNENAPGSGECMGERCQLWNGKDCGLKRESLKDSLACITIAIENLDQGLRR